MSASGEFSVDRRAVAFVVVLVFVVWPVPFLAVLYKLGLHDPVTMDAVEIGVAAGSAFVFLLIPYQAIQQLRGALGVRISERAIARGSTEIPWGEVTAVEEPMFGTLLVKAGARQVEIQTYLFQGREALVRFVREHAPAPG